MTLRPRNLLTLMAVCRCLRVLHGTETAGDRVDSNECVDWDAVWALARRQALGATLGAALSGLPGRERIPEAIADLAEAAYLRNRARNERMREQCLELARALNRHRIVPIALKGAAALFDGRYADLGARYLHDLDLLVPGDRMAEAVSCARLLGYRETGQYDHAFHHPALARPDDALVEFHHHIGAQRDLLPVDRVRARSRALSVDGVEMLVLSPEDAVIHNVFNSEVQDGGHSAGALGLRQLSDLVALCQRTAPELDWRETRERLARQGLGRVLAARLLQANRLLGLPLPEAVPIDWRARLHLRRRLLQVRRPAVDGLFRFWSSVARPLGAHEIDLIYRSGRGPLTLAVYRARHVLVLGSRHRGRIWQRIQRARARRLR